MKDPDDMPVFIIKAKDALAFPAVMGYADLCDEHGFYEQGGQVRLAAKEISRWQHENVDLTKLPDHRHEPKS